MARQKDKLAAKVKGERLLHMSLAAHSRQILELAKTRSEISVKEVEDATGADRNTIKAHVKKLAKQQCLKRAGGRRGTRYAMA